MSLKRLDEIHASLDIKRTMGVRRQEYLDHLTFVSNKRPLFIELMGPIIGLKEEWIAQGATPEELDLSAFKYRQAINGKIDVNTGWQGGEEQEEILEETDEHIIIRDRMGRKGKLCKQSASIPLPLDYPVKNMDDWLKIKHHYEFSESRFGKDWEADAQQYLQDGKVVVVRIPGGFDGPRQLGEIT